MLKTEKSDLALKGLNNKTEGPDLPVEVPFCRNR